MQLFKINNEIFFTARVSLRVILKFELQFQFEIQLLLSYIRSLISINLVTIIFCLNY